MNASVLYKISQGMGWGRLLVVGKAAESEAAITNKNRDSIAFQLFINYWLYCPLPKLS